MKARTPKPQPARVTREIELQQTPEPSLATTTLFDRLEHAGAQEVRDRLSPEERAWLDTHSGLDMRRLTLALGLRDGTGQVAERTGLVADLPPSDVHSMTRDDPHQIGGAYYYADLLTDWLAEVAGGLYPGARILDFSCSSGRVTR